MQKPIIVLCGPTGSGKTAISLPIAQKYGMEIICADSMTVYKGMDIGTDKPTLRRDVIKKNNYFLISDVPHYMLDLFTPDTEFNVSIFKKLAEEKIKEIEKRGHIPLLVGGSTMYLDALLYNYVMPEVEPDKNLRKELEGQTTEKLFKELVKLDPDCEWTIDRNNKRRIIRALEVVKKTGKSFCSQKSRDLLPSNVLYLAVDKPREALYEGINNRVDEMMKEGFLKEVEKLYKKYDHNTAMQAAGYRQLSEYIDARLSLPLAIEKTKQVHRNYAKRQLTWLKGNRDVVWVKNEKEADIKIQKFLSKN